MSYIQILDIALIGQFTMLSTSHHWKYKFHNGVFCELISTRTKTPLDIYFNVIMEGDGFKTALEGVLQFFPGTKLKRERELCLESLLFKQKGVLGVLPTGYGKSYLPATSKSIISRTSSWSAFLCLFYCQTNRKRLF